MILIITKKDSILYKPYKINENDTLLISEKQEKVFLPYSFARFSSVYQRF